MRRILCRIVGASVPDSQDVPPIQDLTGKSPQEIAASLRSWFPETDPITDFNGFFERLSVHIRRQNLVLAPLNVVMFTDGLPDFPGAGRLTTEQRFGKIDMSPLEFSPAAWRCACVR